MLAANLDYTTAEFDLGAVQAELDGWAARGAVLVLDSGGSWRGRRSCLRVRERVHLSWDELWTWGVGVGFATDIEWRVLDQLSACQDVKNDVFRRRSRGVLKPPGHPEQTLSISLPLVASSPTWTQTLKADHVPATGTQAAVDCGNDEGIPPSAYAETLLVERRHHA